MKLGNWGNLTKFMRWSS